MQKEKVNGSFDATHKAKFYVGSSAIGMARVMIGFPIEHPIDAVRV